MLKIGDTVIMPKIDTIFPVMCHPDNDLVEECLLKVVDRPYMEAHWGSVEAADTYAKHRMPTWRGVCYPHTPRERIFSLLRQGNAATFMEEIFSNPAVRADPELSAEVARQYVAATRENVPADAFPLVRMFADALPMILAQMKPGLAGRYLEMIRRTATLMGSQPVRRIDELTLEEYIQIRRLDILGEWIVLLAEFALGLDLGDEIISSELLRYAGDCAIDSVILTNDLFSFYKETSDQDPLNSISIIMREQSLDVSQAIAELARLFHSAETHLQEAHGKLLTGAFADRCDIDAYLTELEHMSSGNFEFHRISYRYHGDQTWWDGSESMPVTIGHILSPDQISKDQDSFATPVD
jgi:hypothetical protein